ncbi:MAG: DUF5615 family PIN-like protein [Bacteroidota bacterium]
MKILLDENMHRQFKAALDLPEIYTVKEQGWTGIVNGKLLRLMVENGFDVLITCDKNMYFQQNIADQPLSIVVLQVLFARWNFLEPLVPKVQALLLQVEKGKFYFIS